MAKKKQLSIHEKRRKELSRLGIRPTKKKEKYSKSEQAKIKREYEEYESILNLDDDEFKTLKVKPSEIDLLREKGIPVTDTGRAFIDLQGYDDAQINFNPHINEKVIERKTEDKIVHTPISDRNILELLKEVHGQRLLPDGVAATVQVGDSPFSERYDSYEKLHDYLKFGFKAKTDEMEDLISKMEIVYFT